jgi:hypothetical protein
MLNKFGLAIRKTALYMLAVILCSLLLTLACTTPQTTDTPQQDTGAPDSYDMPDSTGTPASQQEDSGWKADAVISEGEYSRTASYDDGKYEIGWSSDDEYIYVFIRAETDGFVALGIQPGNTMQQADIIYGAVENGQTSVMDEYSANAFGPHKPDTDFDGGVDNITEYAGIESDGVTIIEFNRKLDTGDSYDHPVNNGVNKIIWAYGSSDNPQFKHISRGYGQIEL